MANNLSDFVAQDKQIDPYHHSNGDRTMVKCTDELCIVFDKMFGAEKL